MRADGAFVALGERVLVLIVVVLGAPGAGDAIGRRRAGLDLGLTGGAGGGAGLAGGGRVAVVVPAALSAGRADAIARGGTGGGLGGAGRAGWRSLGRRWLGRCRGPSCPQRRSADAIARGGTAGGLGGAEARRLAAQSWQAVAGSLSWSQLPSAQGVQTRSLVAAQAAVSVAPGVQAGAQSCRRWLGRRRGPSCLQRRACRRDRS